MAYLFMTGGEDYVEDTWESEGGWDNRLGGPPTWLQGEEFPPGDWRFLFQLEGSDALYDVNFGDADGSEGRILWQCS